PYTRSSLSLYRIKLYSVSYTFSLLDALPIWNRLPCGRDPRDPRPSLGTPQGGATPVRARVRITWHGRALGALVAASAAPAAKAENRKSTRLNSSHVKNSYAVFCLKKKKDHES